MSDKKNDEVKVKVPLSVYDPSDAFYKAFEFGTQDPDMIVDPNADNFDATIIGAVKQLIDDLGIEKLMSIPGLKLVTKDPDSKRGKLVDVEFKPTPNELMRSIVVVRLQAHSKLDFENAKISEDKGGYWLTIKRLNEGYISSMQEYIIKSIEIYTDGGNPAKFKLHKINLQAADPNDVTTGMPRKINAELYIDEDKCGKLEMSYNRATTNDIANSTGSDFYNLFNGFFSPMSVSEVAQF